MSAILDIGNRLRIKSWITASRDDSLISIAGKSCSSGRRRAEVIWLVGVLGVWYAQKKLPAISSVSKGTIWQPELHFNHRKNQNVLTISLSGCPDSGGLGSGLGARRRKQ